MMDLPIMSTASIRVATWIPDSPSAIPSDIDHLAAVLHACVTTGASVSFILPFSYEAAEAFWRDEVLPAVRARTRCVLVARASDAIVGTVQLDLGTPPNQAHRAEVRKLLVHPEYRRQGIATSLMTVAEVEAAKLRRTLLTLDTITGGRAETLYRTLGYRVAGVIPAYALNYDSSALEATTVMYKSLADNDTRNQDGTVKS